VVACFQAREENEELRKRLEEAGPGPCVVRPSLLAGTAVSRVLRAPGTLSARPPWQAAAAFAHKYAEWRFCAGANHQRESDTERATHARERAFGSRLRQLTASCERRLCLRLVRSDVSRGGKRFLRMRHSIHVGSAQSLLRRTRVQPSPSPIMRSVSNTGTDQNLSPIGHSEDALSPPGAPTSRAAAIAKLNDMLRLVEEWEGERSERPGSGPGTRDHHDERNLKLPPRACAEVRMDAAA
jgi:hypothetical protein